MCLRWTITEQFAAPDAMACPSERSRAPSSHPTQDSSGPRPVRAHSLHPDPRAAGPGLGAVPHDHRPDPNRRRAGPAQAAAHRHAGVPPPPRRARLSRRLRPGATLSPATPGATSRNLHPSGTSPRPAARSRFRAHPCRFPRRSTPGPLPRHHLGLLQRPLRPGAALRAYRGHPRRDGRGVRVLRVGPQGSVVGQPQNGGDADPPGSRAAAPPALLPRSPATTSSTHASAWRYRSPLL